MIHFLFHWLLDFSSHLASLLMRQFDRSTSNALQVRIQKNPPACHCTPACVRRGRALKINDIHNLPRLDGNPCVSHASRELQTRCAKGFRVQPSSSALHPPCSPNVWVPKNRKSLIQNRGLGYAQALKKKKSSK